MEGGWIYLLVVLSLAANVRSICDNPTDTFYCETTIRRISCSQWRDNNYTDCGGTDYSDEIFTDHCTYPYSSSSGSFPCNNMGTALSTSILCTEFRDGTSKCAPTTSNPLDSLPQARDEVCMDKAANFTCRDVSKTISCYKYQDGVNDCGDGSDEGPLYNCPLKTNGYMFKCTFRNQNPVIRDFETAICQSIDFLLDGSIECSDGSDEPIKIGDDCSGRTTSTDCDKIIPNSSCLNSVCACNDGYFSVRSNTRCVPRIVDDACTTSVDCTASRTGLDCDTTTNKCYCTTGYYTYNPDGNSIRDDNTICQANKLYEACTVDAECSNVIANSLCTDSLCQCTSDYLPELTTNMTCKSRVIDDACDTTAQCNIGMSNSVCGIRDASVSNSTVCLCHVGGYENSAKTDCTQRVINENCASDAMCSLSPNTTCDTTLGTCQCKTPDVGFPWVISYNNGQCAYGLGDLLCIGDENCTANFGNSACVNGICLCADTYYETSYRDCARFALLDSNCNSNDCSHLTNAECDQYSTCQCVAEYAIDTATSTCIYVGASTSCGFACNYPWALALILILLIACGVVLVIIIIKKPWKKGEETDEQKKPVTGSSQPAYSNGGLAYDNDSKPIWTLRPKSGNPVMYDHMHLQEPSDPEVDAFFSGGTLASVETPDKAHLIEQDDKKVRFDESVPPTPMTPGNIDLDMSRGSESPIKEEAGEDDEDNLGDDDELGDMGEGGEKPAKGKKGKKGKKDKKKGKKSKKGNKNNNAISTPDLSTDDGGDFAEQFAIENEVKREDRLKSARRSISRMELEHLVDEHNTGKEMIIKVQTLTKERAQINLEEKLTYRRQKRYESEHSDDN